MIQYHITIDERQLRTVINELAHAANTLFDIPPSPVETEPQDEFLLNTLLYFRGIQAQRRSETAKRSK